MLYRVLGLWLVVVGTGCTDKAVESISALQSSDFEQSIMLARNNGCLRCHQLRAPLVGPTWMAVAERYRNAPDARQMLIDKVKSGGNGNWNQLTGGAKMPAHANRVSDAHIAQIIDFILSLKIEK